MSLKKEKKGRLTSKKKIRERINEKIIDLFNITNMIYTFHLFYKYSANIFPMNIFV